MAIAALYDIHGNVPALDAVLDELDDLSIERILVGGDVLPGPMPAETIDRLLGLDVPVEFIRGNCEVAVLAAMNGAPSPYRLPEQVQKTIDWTAEQLRDGYRATLTAWPRTVSIRVEGIGDVLFCHGTPRDENECFTRLTPEASLRPIFDTLGAAAIVCGHTHMQFDRTVGSTRVVNAGSLGMPFGEPGAYWLLIGADLELRRTAYDLDAAAARIRRSRYPGAEEFADQYVLHPPAEREMLELFTRAGVK